MTMFRFSPLYLGTVIRLDDSAPHDLHPLPIQEAVHAFRNEAEMKLWRLIWWMGMQYKLNLSKSCTYLLVGAAVIFVCSVNQ